MTIEEKAKAYDEAKARMSRAFNSNRCTLGFMNEIFPELKESEDERIRKELIAFLKTYKTLSTSRYISWLEKQSEHAIACSEEQMKVLDEVLNFAANHESPYWNDYIFETLNNLIRQLKSNNDTLDDKDEEIRKALINVFATHKDYEMFFGVSVEDIRAWLER